MSIIDTKPKADLAVSAPILLGRAQRKSGVWMVVTQAALVLTVRLQQSLMSSSAFYLLAETFDPAEHTSTLQQFFRTLQHDFPNLLYQ